MAMKSDNISVGSAEYGATPRVSGASQGISMLKVGDSQAAAGHQGFLESEFVGGDKTFSSQHEIQKFSECNGDNLSCISGAESLSISGDNRCIVDRKNVSCSSDSISSFLPGGLEKTVDVQLGACSQGNLSQCIREQEESSSRVASIIPDGSKQNSLYDNSKTEVKERDPAIEVEKLLDHHQNLLSHQLHNVQGSAEQTQTVNCSDEDDLLEDVKVCDICGDAGREELLATCSKCTDGAEHIYCMRVKLEKVPERSWICEDCMLQEDSGKQKQNVFPKVMRTPQDSSSNEMHQNAGNANTNVRELDTKGPVLKKRGREDSSNPICAKIPMGNLESDTIVKKRALDSRFQSPSKSSLSREVLFSQTPRKILDNAKVKPDCKASISGSYTFNAGQRNACSSKFSRFQSPKSRTDFQISQGVLTKSNSFNISSSVQSQAKHIIGKRKFSHETACTDKRKHRIVRLLSKSSSFSNDNAGRSKASDSNITMLSSNIFHSNHLKRSAYAEEHNLTQRKCEAKLDNSKVSSPMSASRICATRIDERIASHDRTMSSHSSGTKCHLKAVHHLAHEGPRYLNNNQADTDVGKTRHSCSSEMVGNPSSPTKSVSSHEMKSNLVIDKDCVGLAASVTAGRHRNSSISVQQNSIPHPIASCKQGRTAQKTSSFISVRQHTSAGNATGHAHEFPNIGEATETCPTNPQTSALDVGNLKEEKESNDKYYRPIFDNQTDPSSTLAIPEFDYVWKGVFKIHSSGRFPSFCYGVQAHLSTFASPRVPELVKKFPGEIPLKEVSRLTVWPNQFLVNYPKEDSIGVYFFSEDVVSYEGSYRNLTECMINYDLALKGDVDGVDLLIFSSNLLPENSQRWNKLFYLWGVFRRRVGTNECMPTSYEKPFIPGIKSNVCSEENCSVYKITGISSMTSGQSGECLFPSRLFSNAQESSTVIHPQELPSASSNRKNWNYGHQPSYDEQKHGHSQRELLRQPNTDDIITSKQPCRDAEYALTSLEERGHREKRWRDNQPSSQVSNNSLILGSDDNNLRVANKYPLSVNEDEVHDKLAVHSERQVLSSDHKVSNDASFLDLGLSLGVSQQSGKENPESTFNKAIAEKVNQSKDWDSVASNKNNNGSYGKPPAFLELSLALPYFHGQ
ncbi:uncharacterized protein LOC127812692 isoform X2 [Diospyros lotus]|uniref:uncharacterized protein LOC127812692 isoform X2 n=1 Tax=Diospyros lotus TaxID=55363 RepID=UPI00225A2F2E|nr:uncharacterized protein LOC127812692 isoform X2 [Diospyros lotus]